MTCVTTTPSSMDGIKRLATAIKREMGLPHHQALDAAALRAGYMNLRHAQAYLEPKPSDPTIISLAHLPAKHKPRKWHYKQWTPGNVDLALRLLPDVSAVTIEFHGTDTYHGAINDDAPKYMAIAFRGGRVLKLSGGHFGGWMRHLPPELMDGDRPLSSNPYTAGPVKALMERLRAAFELLFTDAAQNKPACPLRVVIDADTRSVSTTARRWMNFGNVQDLSGLLRAQYQANHASGLDLECAAIARSIVERGRLSVTMELDANSPTGFRPVTTVTPWPAGILDLRVSEIIHQPSSAEVPPSRSSAPSLLDHVLNRCTRAARDDLRAMADRQDEAAIRLFNALAYPDEPTTSHVTGDGLLRRLDDSHEASFARDAYYVAWDLAWPKKPIRQLLALLTSDGGATPQAPTSVR